MKRKYTLLPFLLSVSLGLSLPAGAVLADEAEDKPIYALPGGQPATATAVPEETPAPTGAPEEGDDAPIYVLPGEATSAPKPTASASPTAKPAEDGKADETALSDAEFMDTFTLSFIDGITELNPASPSKQIMAVLTKVPEERIGEAQWYLNGEPVTDHYSGAFPIRSGKVTAFTLPVSFAKGMQETGATVALELRLNGAVRRIEKEITYHNYTDEEYDTMERDRVLNLVRPMEIPAVLKQKVTTFADKYLSCADGSLPAGAEVIYVDHYSDHSAYLYLPEEDRFCWVTYYSVKVSGENLVTDGDYTDEEKTIFANAKGYASNTDYLIWINLEHQKINLFIGEEGNWKLERVMACATGANQTPTPTGITTYSKYENGWFNPTYYVKPVLYINPARAIALHSILFHPDGRVQDGTLGRNVSHGCIRMAPEDINYLAEYVPIGTTVVVF